MRIDFTRSGGLAGLQLKVSVDTDVAPAEQASNLSMLVKKADFFNLPGRITPERSGPDRFEYRVEVATSEQTHEVVVHEAAAPESLRPLLNYLTTLAIVSKRL